MRHTRKKESDSTSARLVKKKGKKSKSSINKSPSKKRSLSKRIDRGTKKKTSLIQTRMTKQKAQKARKPIVTKKHYTKLRVSRKSDSQKTKSTSRVFRSPSRKQTATRGVKKRIIRVLGQGQFSVDSETLRKLNSIDNSIVRKFETENLTDQEFKLKMEQLEEIVTKKGKLLIPK